MDGNFTNTTNPIDNNNQTTNITTHSICDGNETILVAILFICCLIAMCVNVIVIASIHWIRGPMTPILKMSLSLAAADFCSSCMFAISLFVEHNPNMKAFFLLTEMIMLSGIVITVVHLLALSLNHYIGILKPLHYNAIMTRRKVNAIICHLWIVPIILVVSLYSIEGGMEFWKNLNNDFMNTFRFRVSYSTLFFIPIILMAFFYTHILVIVRRQQTKWKKLSRLGSTRFRGRTVTSCTNNRVNKDQRQLEGNIRAICTTLLIMGSCFIGWMPALLVFSLMCKTDCPVYGDTLEDLNNNKCASMSLRFIENMLIIMKMLANPVIYSIRMKEIEGGRTRMYLAITSIFCPSRRQNSNYNLAYHNSPMHQNSGTSVHVRITSFRVNGNPSQTSTGQSEALNNTFL